MNDLNEARRNMLAVLGEDIKKQYFAYLKAWFTYEMTKIQCYTAVKKLFKTEEQLACHNEYMLALGYKVYPKRMTGGKGATDRGSFEMADLIDYVPPSSMAMMIPPNIVDRSAASEFFLPDNSFITTKIEMHIWENGLNGADENVAEYLVQACQSFVKNILTAMISKKESYKLRDNHFQYGFGFPVRDPLIRNSNNVIDYTQESKVNVANDDDSFIPAFKPTLENIEQQTAFDYACGKRTSSGEKLTVKLLYDTLRENPNIVGLHSINSVNLLKVGLQLEEQ